MAAQTIAITTAQNVTLDYQLANLGDRILGYILDVLIKAGYLILIFLLIVPQIGGNYNTTLTVLMFILFLPVVFYSLIFEAFNDGQTPGKKAMNMKVVHMEGGEVNFASHFLRWLFRIVDISIMSGIVGVVAIALSEKGQRIGDVVANTTVISLKEKTEVHDSGYVQVSENYQPVYPAASALRTVDIATIKEVLAIRGEKGFELRTQLAEKLESVLGVIKHESSEIFLRQIVNDFNYYEQRES